MYKQFKSMQRTPALLIFFFVLVAFLSSEFSQWGMEGIFFAVFGAGLVTIGGWVVLKAIARKANEMLDGKPNEVDHLLAPTGYRRRRYAESREEYVRESVVVPTPNRPLYPSEEEEDMIVDAIPAARALVKATPKAMMPQRLAKKQFRSTDLELAPNFNPPLTQIVGRALLCLGQRGSGKSNFAALFIEQVCKLFLPAVIFDYLCDFDTLPDVLPNCRIGGYPTWENARHYPYNYWEVDISNAVKIGYLIRENGGQLVIELESYPSNDYAAQVIIGVVKGMFNWANDRKPDKRLPALVVLDEAQQFLPQNLADTENKETTQSILRTFKKLNEVGRHSGLTPALFTQRAARINKDVIGGTEIYVLMRQLLPQDLKVCEDLLGKENVDRQKIASFDNGDALIFEGGESFQVHFDLRQSEHKSSMPAPEKVQARYQTREVQKTVTLASFEDDLDEDEVLDGAYPTDDYDPLVEDEDIETESLPQAQQPVQKPVKQQVSTDLERGVNAWREGATSIDKLAAALDLTSHQARKLKPQVEAEIARLDASENA